MSLLAASAEAAAESPTASNDDQQDE